MELSANGRSSNLSGRPIGSHNCNGPYSADSCNWCFCRIGRSAGGGRFKSTGRRTLNVSHLVSKQFCYTSASVVKITISWSALRCTYGWGDKSQNFQFVFDLSAGQPCLQIVWNTVITTSNCWVCCFQNKTGHNNVFWCQHKRSTFVNLSIIIAHFTAGN